jgi:hypothetical protein
MQMLYKLFKPILPKKSIKKYIILIQLLKLIYVLVGKDARTILVK